jgi:hypothetical protein
MFVFGSKRSVPRRGMAAAERSEVSPEGRRFELALLVAGLPEVGRAESIERLLPLVKQRPAWDEEAVGDEAAEQCRCWWPLADERLREQTPRGLLLTLQTEIEAGLRSAASPLWLLNRIVRRVWLLHQGQRVGQVYRELERQLGDEGQALARVRQMLAGLGYVGVWGKAG